MTVTIEVGNRDPYGSLPGAQLVIGRDAGPGQLGAEDRTVSRRHGIITAAQDHWTVQATGTRSGLVVYDHETPSRILLSRGVGPVIVPFASASVVVEVRLRRYAVTVEGPGAPGWAGSWASAIGDGADPQPRARRICPGRSVGRILRRAGRFAGTRPWSRCASLSSGRPKAQRCQRRPRRAVPTDAEIAHGWE
jgi:hypothetical protein